MALAVDANGLNRLEHLFEAHDTDHSKALDRVETAQLMKTVSISCFLAAKLSDDCKVYKWAGFSRSLKVCQAEVNHAMDQMRAKAVTYVGLTRMLLGGDIDLAVIQAPCPSFWSNLG